MTVELQDEKANFIYEIRNVSDKEVSFFSSHLDDDDFNIFIVSPALNEQVVAQVFKFKLYKSPLVVLGVNESYEISVSKEKLGLSFEGCYIVHWSIELVEANDFTKMFYGGAHQSGVCYLPENESFRKLDSIY